jgi:hypothetical protein
MVVAGKSDPTLQMDRTGDSFLVGEGLHEKEGLRSRASCLVEIVAQQRKQCHLLERHPCQRAVARRLCRPKRTRCEIGCLRLGGIDGSAGAEQHRERRAPGLTRSGQDLDVSSWVFAEAARSPRAHSAMPLSLNAAPAATGSRAVRASSRASVAVNSATWKRPMAEESMAT